MKYVFELYYRNDNEIVYCGTIDTEKEALDDVIILGNEFPENEYWYEGVRMDT